MKKGILICLLLVSVLCAVFAVSFACDNARRYNRLSAGVNAQTSATEARLTRLEADAACYAVLKAHEGIIGIYDRKEQYLLGTINTPVKLLPENDRRKLLEGIRIKDAAELTAVFEDYSS